MKEGCCQVQQPSFYEKLWELLNEEDKIVISLTDACLAVIYCASSDAEFGTDFGLHHAIHIAIKYGKLQRRELQGIHKSIIFRVIHFICVLATIAAVDFCELCEPEPAERDKFNGVAANGQ